MDIYGIDFTSAPCRRKPITCAHCWLDGGLLRLAGIHAWTSFDPFEAFLRQPGQWVCGMDFPFGQPRRLLENLAWPTTWSQYVGLIADLGKTGFEAALTSYRQPRPPGDKQHLRQTDLLAKSRSPMMLYGVPVGKMFYQGATRLLRSEVCVLPCRPMNNPRHVIEAYPALVARRWTGGKGYKCDTVQKQTPRHRAARQDIAEGLQSEEFIRTYGFKVDMTIEHFAAIVEDGTGDWLDALLCAIQAGWSYLNQSQQFGIPAGIDNDEGWIIDPSMWL